MAAYSPHLPAVLIGVGAAFDFIGGTVKRAPVWMQKAGLEWFYRLCQEPGRSEARDQRSEARDQRSEARGQRSEVGGQQAVGSKLFR